MTRVLAPGTVHMLLCLLAPFVLMIREISASSRDDESCLPRVVCYMTNWAIYRHSLGQFSALNVPPHLCTHAHYAFGSFDDNQRLGPSDGNADFSRKGYEQFAELKKHNPSLKTMISLGGAASVQERFEDMAEDPVKVRRFVKNSMDFMRLHKFDGLEIDWQSPSSAENHARLVEALSAAFNTVGRRQTRGLKPFLLSVTLPANLTRLQNNFHVQRVAQAADYIVSLQYRYHSPTANVTGHHAPLGNIPGADPDLNMQSSSLMYRTLGVTPKKIVLGVATFGITFTLEETEKNGLNAPTSGPGKAGKITKSPGTLSFYEICENIAINDWRAVREYPRALGPYASKGNQWVAYDDEEMMRTKGAFIRDGGLGGAAVWSLSQDDFRGFCTGVQFPLVTALKEGLYSGNLLEPTTTPVPPTTPQFDARKIFECPADGNFAKKDDCTKFYFCKNGEFEELSCPDDERFAVLESKCSADAVCINKEPDIISTLPVTSPPSSSSQTTHISTRVTPSPIPSSPPVLTSPTTHNPTVDTNSGNIKPTDSPGPKSITDIDQQINSSSEISELFRLLTLVRDFNKFTREQANKYSPSIPERMQKAETSSQGVSDQSNDGEYSNSANPLKIKVTVEVSPSIE